MVVQLGCCMMFWTWLVNLLWLQKIYLLINAWGKKWYCWWEWLHWFIHMVVFILHACGGFMASKSHEGWIFYIGWKRCNLY
jgi:hypothetical protein